MLQRLSWWDDEKYKSPLVQWRVIESILEQAESDVLSLLHCCDAGTSNANEGTRILTNVPRILLAIRLKDDFQVRKLFSDIFKEFLRIILGFQRSLERDRLGSFSSLVLVLISLKRGENHVTTPIHLS
jgi:hypothetical protein